MEIEIKSKDKLDLGLKELWDYRELFYFFTWRDIKIKYKQTPCTEYLITCLK